MNHSDLIDNWIRMDKATVNVGLTAEAMSAMSDEITSLRQRAEAAERELNQLRPERDRLSKRNAELSDLLRLAYSVYRDAGGKVGNDSIFSYGEWILWLPTQTDESLIADFRA